MASQAFNVPPSGPAPTQYRIPPAGNPKDPNDITTFVPSQADWAIDKLPPLMGQIERLPHQTILEDVQMLTRGGQPVLGNQGRPLRDFSNYLPDHICSEVEGWRLACWLSVDDRCQYKDLLDRMSTGALKNKPVNIGTRITNTFRTKLNQPCLSNAVRRSDIQKTELMVLDKLTPEQIRHNTTWNITPWGMVQQDPNSLANVQAAAHPFKMDTTGGRSSFHVPSHRLARAINKLRRVRREAAQKGLADWKQLPDSIIQQVSDIYESSNKRDSSEDDKEESGDANLDGVEGSLSPDDLALLEAIRGDSEPYQSAESVEPGTLDKGKAVDRGPGGFLDVDIDRTEVGSAKDIETVMMQEAEHRSRLDYHRAQHKTQNGGESSRVVCENGGNLTTGQPELLDMDLDQQGWFEGQSETETHDTSCDLEIDRELLDPLLFQVPTPFPASSEHPQQGEECVNRSEEP
ncbi:MAG: hypothetical protein M1812_003742 [Candelaria pacifica]|nr:MAG: hypothetical protein M1812_003742 [Candelaria pacifica]